MITVSRILSANPSNQGLALKFIKFVKGLGLKFAVSDTGDSVYVRVQQGGRSLKIRFADHGVPVYKDPRHAEFRKSDYSVDPHSKGTLEGAFSLVQETF